PIRASGRRSATRKCGRPWRADDHRGELCNPAAQRRLSVRLLAGRFVAYPTRIAMKTYTNPVYRFTRPAELDAPGERRPIVIVGAGPVGLAAAIDLGQRGIPVVVLDEDRTVSVGSRAICYAKRALEILDRLGCAQPVVAKGISWNVGKVFFRDELVYRFDLLAEAGHRRPAFVNLQQYWLEEYLVGRATSLAAIDMRWESKAV